MRQLALALTIFGIAAIYSNPAIHARECCGGKGQGWMKYDRSTVETRKGTVADIEDYDRGGLHVNLKTDKETINVHLGPASFLDKKIRISKGDVLTVTGSRVTYNKAAAIIAREVEKGGVKIQLRRDDGTPLWTGQGRGYRAR